MPHVYKITHLPTNAVYVGSAKDIEARWHGHRARLKNGTHPSKNMQSLWDEDGCDAFAISSLETVSDHAALFSREQHWIDVLAAAKEPNFNVCQFAGSTKSRAVSEHTRQKMSGPRIKLGKPMTEVQFAAICALLRSPPGPAQEAARLVLVEQLRPVDAATLTGVSSASVSNSVTRIRRGMELAEVAARTD